MIIVGEFDELDQYVAYCSIYQHNKKWWMKAFLSHFDNAITNAFILHPHES